MRVFLAQEISLHSQDSFNINGQRRNNVSSARMVRRVARRVLQSAVFVIRPLEVGTVPRGKDCAQLRFRRRNGAQGRAPVVAERTVHDTVLGRWHSAEGGSDCVQLRFRRAPVVAERTVHDTAFGRWYCAEGEGLCAAEV
ncbi:hypothetical protein NDU88_001121 [Pleurodeles waltl]|uniref:Uncharacterized protein n=1 Tax=Pleurodeles waltl TaxID=8319 RepID=A0AAV7R7N4_PLEWA|nr:hypothetical protein NDU88_001121 [Pleurodeles waltl]